MSAWHRLINGAIWAAMRREGFVGIPQWIPDSRYADRSKWGALLLPFLFETQSIDNR